MARNHNIYCVSLHTTEGVRGSGAVTRKRAWEYIRAAQMNSLAESIRLYVWGKQERMPVLKWQWERKARR